jgi:hypothetical protein
MKILIKVYNKNKIIFLFLDFLGNFKYFSFFFFITGEKGFGEH